MRTPHDPRCDDLDDAKTAVAVLLAEGAPTVDRLAMRMGWRVRTLQRRLARRGSSFSALLETVRRERALEGLRNRDLPFADLSMELGYSRQSALTRAIRRWLGASPRDMRHDLADDQSGGGRRGDDFKPPRRGPKACEVRLTVRARAAD